MQYDTIWSRNSGFAIDAEVEVFTHKNRKMTYKIKIYASTWRTVLCTYFLVLSDRSAVSTSSRRKGKRSSTGIELFCVVSLDMSMRIAITPFCCFRNIAKISLLTWLSKGPKTIDIHVVDSQKWRNDSHFSKLRVILTLGFETLREPWKLKLGNRGPE